MKSLAELAKRVQDHLRYCPISEEDVMRMIARFGEYAFNDISFSFKHRGQVLYDADYSCDLFLNFNFKKTKSIKASLSLDFYDDENFSGIYCELSDYFIRLGAIRLFFKPIDTSYYRERRDTIDKIRYKKERVKSKMEFLKNHIDFEKTINEIKNEKNMWGESTYLGEPSKSKYDEKTFEEMLQILNNFERRQKLIEILN